MSGNERQLQSVQHLVGHFERCGCGHDGRGGGGEEGEFCKHAQAVARRGELPAIFRVDREDLVAQGGRRRDRGREGGKGERERERSDKWIDESTCVEALRDELANMILNIAPERRLGRL